MSLVLLLDMLNWRHQKASLRRVPSTASNKISRFSKPCLDVLKKNVGFRPLFKPIKLNLASVSSERSCLVYWCYWYYKNYFQWTILFNLPRATSKLAWEYFWDGSETNRSKVPLQTRWTSLQRFSILEARARPWAIKRQLQLINN